MTLTFKYKSQPRLEGLSVKSPSIPVTLIGNASLSVDVAAVLDSGADISAIPQDVAELLNVDLSGERSKARGIGGEAEVVRTKVKLSIKGSHDEHYDFILPIQVILGDSKIPVLLGRTGFFDKFIITFNQFEEKIILKRVKPFTYQ